METKERNLRARKVSLSVAGEHKVLD